MENGTAANYWKQERNEKKERSSLVAGVQGRTLKDESEDRSSEGRKHQEESNESDISPPKCPKNQKRGDVS